MKPAYRTNPVLKGGARIWCVGLLGFGVAVALSSEQAHAQDPKGRQSAQPADNLLRNPGFETLKPSLWEPSGMGARWTNETSRTPDWSLSLSGSEESAWIHTEAVQEWITGFPQVGNPPVEVGGWIKMEGVNTHPQSDDEKFQLVFEFFTDTSRTRHLVGGPVTLDLPQDESFTGKWVEVLSGPLDFSGSQAPSASVTFRKGANARGSAFLDDIFIRNADQMAKGWAGHYFNPNMDVGDGWIYWWDDFGGGNAGWPSPQSHVVTVSDQEAHSGNYSLCIEANGQNPFEGVGISSRVPVREGEALFVSFWVKYSETAHPESIGTGLNNLGLSILWFDHLTGGVEGYGVLEEIILTLDGLSNDRMIPLLGRPDEWLHYAFVVYNPPGAAAAQVRIRYWHEFQGLTYWDDLVVVPVTDDFPAGVTRAVARDHD